MAPSLGITPTTYSQLFFFLNLNIIIRIIGINTKSNTTNYPHFKKQFFIFIYFTLSAISCVRGSTLSETTHLGQAWVAFQQEVLVRNMELICHHQPEEFWKGQKVTPCIQPSPRILLVACILAEKCISHQEGLWVRMIGQRQLENNTITIKPKTARPMAEQFSWVPLPCCSLAGHTFPIKFLALSAHVSPWSIHFWVLEKSSLLGPWRGSPFLQELHHVGSLLH